MKIACYAGAAVQAEPMEAADTSRTELHTPPPYSSHTDTYESWSNVLVQRACYGSVQRLVTALKVMLPEPQDRFGEFVPGSSLLGWRVNHTVHEAKTLRWDDYYGCPTYGGTGPEIVGLIVKDDEVAMAGGATGHHSIMRLKKGRGPGLVIGTLASQRWEGCPKGYRSATWREYRVIAPEWLFNLLLPFWARGVALMPTANSGKCHVPDWQSADDCTPRWPWLNQAVPYTCMGSGWTPTTKPGADFKDVAQQFFASQVVEFNDVHGTGWASFSPVAMTAWFPVVAPVLERMAAGLRKMTGTASVTPARCARLTCALVPMLPVMYFANNGSAALRPTYVQKGAYKWFYFAKEGGWLPSQSTGGYGEVVYAMEYLYPDNAKPIRKWIQERMAYDFVASYEKSWAGYERKVGRKSATVEKTVNVTVPTLQVTAP